MHKWSAVLILVAACGDNTDGGGPTPGGGILEPPDPDAGIQLALVHPLAPGEEIHWCKYVVLDRAIDVGRFEHAYTEGSHHVIAYTTPFTAATVPLQGDFDCEGGANQTFNGVGYVGATPVGELALPDGVGLHFDAGAVVLLEGHYLNPTDAPLEGEVALNLFDTGSPPTQQAGTLFFYDNNIYVPANGSATARMHCEIPQPINVISLLSHMHSRGIRYQAKANDIQILATDDWLNPEPMVLGTPMQLAAGTSIDYFCEFKDTTGTAVMEGPSKDTNEMCMLIGMYWPRLDFGHELCAAPGSGSVFDGTQTCGQTLGCMQNAGADALTAEQCIVNTCRASSGAVNAVQGCVFQNCVVADKCEGGDCSACMVAECGGELGACQQATCQ
jgi:hypothetical protein